MINELITLTKTISMVWKFGNDIYKIKDSILYRFSSSIDYFDLYNIVKDPSFDFKSGKKYKVKNVFFSPFSLMQSPVSRTLFVKNGLETGGAFLLRLDNRLNIHNYGTYSEGYQLPVYSYPHNFIENQYCLGFLYENPNDISIKINQVDLNTLKDIESKPVIIVKYSNKYINSLNTMIDCTIELKPIQGVDDNLKGEYKDFALSKMYNGSNYSGFYAEISDIKSSDEIKEDVNIKFDVSVKDVNNFDFYSVKDKIHYSLGNVTCLTDYQKFLSSSMTFGEIYFGNTVFNSEPVENYKPKSIPFETPQSYNTFVNYFPQDYTIQFGRNTNLKNFQKDKLLLQNQISDFTKKIKIFEKKIKFETCITSDGISDYWNKKIEL